MSEKFMPGDIVELKSGGPKMMVVSIDVEDADDAKVCCEWFDERNRPQKETFHRVAIQKPAKKARRVAKIIKH